MYKVIVKNECSCFKESGFKANSEFENEDEAFDFALELKEKMNKQFCSKHSFEVLKIFNSFNITFAKSLDKALKCCGSGCCK